MGNGVKCTTASEAAALAQSHTCSEEAAGWSLSFAHRNGLAVV